MKDFLNNIDGKNGLLKKRILGLCITDGDLSIADISIELGASIPTVTKLLNELIDDGFIEDLGKLGTSGGRKPNIYGLCASAGYLIGVDIRRHHISVAVTDFKGNSIDYQEDIPFALESSEESFRKMSDLLISHITKLGISKDKVLAYGINLTGRVNCNTGFSFSYFIGEEKPLDATLEEMLGNRVFIDNDSRAMTYGEYICGAGNGERNMLFINLSWGLGMGMILDGKLSYGKSGFSGEIGHFPFRDNDIICRCGKIGCLETVASGSAIHRVFLEKLKEGRTSVLRPKYERGEEISLDEIIDAVKDEDVLAIEAIEITGRELGRAIAGLINIFNPELVVIGGRLAVAKDYLMLPIMGAINKYSLIVVSKDTILKFSKLGTRGGALGACMLSRSKLLGLV
ncbi:MAG: ROK family transcriptional regulator [Bacteroidetes bacterium]|uniref:ROK family transcriptional regulator n=1 Tax=Candidatus Cryptobacteroides intestinavium TaxID=2840766 RepID=A0A9D9EQB1_9BACT|nr:ROK family transcriptional regulator [Candidatus Cryptobacteroides intestinavium]